MARPFHYLVLLATALTLLSGCTVYRLNQQVVKLHREGRYAEALPLAEKALAIREKNLGPDSPGVAYTLNNLALLHEALGEYQAAEPLYRRALTIYRQAYGPEHKYVATAQNNLAALYYYLGKYGKLRNCIKSRWGPDSCLRAEIPGSSSELQQSGGTVSNLG